jgi:uncharacterized protein YecE (DUF72 family)
MEFGKLQNINKVDWTLPAEDPLTISLLSNIPKTHIPMDFRYGAPAWGRKEWLGKVYPLGTKPADFLYHYSRYFNCIELNSTHYRIPEKPQVMRWVAQVPNTFLFCPKIPQLISHEPGGLTDPVLLQLWLNSIAEFGDNLGPCFLQLPPTFDYFRKSELFTFLKMWPDDVELALEFRHRSWFQDGRVLPALTEYLQKRKIGLVITDVAGRRDVLHTTVSSTFVFLRFIGNNLHPTDFQRAEAWAKQIAIWKQLGLPRIFFIIHEPDDISAPEMTEQVIKDLNRFCEAQIPELPKLTLF